jgi:phage terminase small subunit
MGNVRKLTTKQHKFAVLLVTKGDRMSAKECAIEAGFSEKSAQQAAANLTNPKMFPLEDAGNWAAAVAAEKSRGQAAGLYIDRKEILTGSIDQLSKAEVEEKLREIEKQFSINTDVIEIQPED